MAARRKSNMQKEIKLSWIIFIVILALSLIAELLFYHPSDKALYFEKISFFHAWFGFASCALIVIVSKLLGFILKRPEHYYDKKD